MNMREYSMVSGLMLGTFLIVMAVIARIMIMLAARM